MGSNRKRPFGYTMECGRVVIHPVESREVQYIFTGYQMGASFQMLADTMSERGIRYDGDKPWNKNMIGRILADDRYVGEDAFPQIIPLEQFAAVSEKRSKRSGPIQPTQVHKLLGRKCESTVTAAVESEVLRLLNSLCGESMRLRSPASRTEKSETVVKLEKQLNELLGELPVEEIRATETVFELAATRYEAIGMEVYETQRLQKIFRDREPDEELDADLIRETISEVIVGGNGKVRIKLKNNQIIGGETA